MAQVIWRPKLSQEFKPLGLMPPPRYQPCRVLTRLFAVPTPEVSMPTIGEPLSQFSRAAIPLNWVQTRLPANFRLLTELPPQAPSTQTCDKEETAKKLFKVIRNKTQRSNANKRPASNSRPSTFPPKEILRQMKSLIPISDIQYQISESLYSVT